MGQHYAGTHASMTILSLSHMTNLLTTPQTRKPRSAKPWRQVQEVADAFHTDGKHLTFSPRMRTTALEHALARPIPDR